MMKKAKSERKKRSATGRKSQAQICSACVCKKVFQFCPRGLAGRAGLIYFWIVRQADAKTQLEQFAPDPFCSPQSIVPCHLLDQGHGLWGYPWFGRSCPGLVLPGPNHPCQKHQKHPIRFGAGWSFHVSAQDEKLLSERLEAHACHVLDEDKKTMHSV
jgi:hypothetical protein